MNLYNSNILYFLVLKYIYMWKHQIKAIQQILNTKKANQSYIYFQSTSNKQKSRRELTHCKTMSFLELAKRSGFLQLGILAVIQLPRPPVHCTETTSQNYCKKDISDPNWTSALLCSFFHSALAQELPKDTLPSLQARTGRKMRMSPYPGCEVDGSSAVQQQRGHVDVAVVRSDVQRGEAALQRETTLVMETLSYKITGSTRTWFWKCCPTNAPCQSYPYHAHLY